MGNVYGILAWVSLVPLLIFQKHVLQVAGNPRRREIGFFSTLRYFPLVAFWPVGVALAIWFLIAENKGDDATTAKAGAIFLGLTGVASRIETDQPRPTPIDLSNDERFGSSS